MQERGLVTLPEGETVHLKRRPDAELQALRALTAAGFEKIPSHTLDTFGRPRKQAQIDLQVSAWLLFASDTVEDSTLNDYRTMAVDVVGGELIMAPRPAIATWSSRSSITRR